jgi:hypothetical protein
VQGNGPLPNSRTRCRPTAFWTSKHYKAEAQEKAVISQYKNRRNLTPVREQQLIGIFRNEELAKQDYSRFIGQRAAIAIG